jgi:hypothetical protein
VVDLMAALKESLAQMEGRKKGPQRAIESQRENTVQLREKSAAAPKKAGKKRAG